MKLIDLKNKRICYTITSKKDAWFDDIITNRDDQTEKYVVFTNGFLSIKMKVKLLLEKYYIIGIYDLKNFLKDSCAEFTLYKLSVKPKKAFEVGYYYGCVKKSKNVYTDEYKEYLDLVENHINGVTKSRKGPTYEFLNVPAKEMDENNLFAGYYSSFAKEAREEIENDKMVPLESVADVIKNFSMIRIDEKKILPINPSYPLKLEELKSGIPGAKLQKGDIVLRKIEQNNSDKVHAYLYDDNYEVYASISCIVIRPRKISSEYLFLYLMSNTFRRVFFSLFNGTAIRQISIKNVLTLPIPLPRNQNREYYYEAFKYYVNENYHRNFELNDSNRIELLAADRNESVAISELFEKELISSIRLKEDNQLIEMLKRDIEEVNICFKNGAYKAAIILSGSILEAVLIDWLSELHKVNYFENQYRIYLNGREKNGDLIDYINAIQEIKKPKWIKEAKAAHEIRKQRNNVHAKLCMKSDRVLDKKTCREVIKYLEYVINSRISSKKSRIDF